MKQTLPTLNLEHYTHGNALERQKFVQQLGEALTQLGFFAVSNHSVDLTLVDKAYNVAAAFFQQSNEVKNAYEKKEYLGKRGYVGFAKERAKGMGAADLKEFWHIGQQLPAGHPLERVYPKNLWPKSNDAPQQFRDAFTRLYKQYEACAKTLLEACSSFLKLGPDFLPSLAEHGDSIQRIIHYPPLPETAPKGALRAAAHEDINLITLLCESTAPGLEILHRDGTWVGVHVHAGNLIVDSGDMLQNLSNGIIKSTTHRVTNPPDNHSARYSMPFFVHPRPEVDLSPVQKCIDASGGQATYPSLTAGEYLANRLTENGLAA
ncbi:MAG: 2-oxoglutarate and iron-dependent oxygenase domain-containing protein [Myxococcota bacterium]|nr:2-oxoglutarate and iron-dependent oxygenase domain-containing protein [Myxococcota bacterium]